MHGNNANTDREEEEEYSERLNLICQFAVKDEESDVLFLCFSTNIITISRR